ncbi:MAG: TetR/AcrR family transcriptional regulator [Balneolaceae bacterium]|nr:MAG: TetR/AcrR family transcriptional regulator [Balneolaceae bacterium]
MSQFNSELRRLILDEARHLMITQGYNSLSMRKIASKAGCSATSIYLYFRNKDDLLHALIEEGFEMLRARLVETAATIQDPLQRLEALCREYVQFGLLNPEYYEVMFLLRPEHMERYPVEKFRRARKNLELITDTLNMFDRGGQYKAGDAYVRAHAITASLHGAVVLVNAGRLDVRIDKSIFVDTVILQIMQSLKSYTIQAH